MFHTLSEMTYRAYRQRFTLGAFPSFKCHCGLEFPSVPDLSDHASMTGHSPFKCLESDCNAQFSRSDALKRHAKEHDNNAPRYPCKLCKKYRGRNGFKRKDKLTQHMQGYHQAEIGEKERHYGMLFSCPLRYCQQKMGSVDEAWDHIRKRHGKMPKNVAISRFIISNGMYRSLKACCIEGCPRSQKGSFTRKADYTNHIKKEHDISPFFCEEQACDRVGGKGFFQKRALMKHLRKVHDLHVDLTTMRIDDDVE